ncbi:SipW-dependent-type signal peptide-containing protein [Microbacterium sp.]|uniref:SipW-dependent-type signal peptide-containing protein n=1 Tax=Microbacterium sp. TaxID=51671 RepID=UPI0027365B83|nr:SipW-dependent-type signal peptide-containing protein [Microbacterium sp.]MDP3950404.1 SipW-dependent-type signal peptide-containing protein [Microbacterium sp.]
MNVKTTNRRKVLAVLAGGLVLGVGTAVTLAAWNDSEFATGTFTAGAFNLEGSTTSATAGFAEHPDESTAAAIAFTAGFDNIAPEDVVYAPFWVRLDATTTDPATLTANAPTSTGANAANLSYDVYSIGAAAACDETATSGTLVASGTDLTGFAAGSGVSLAAGPAPAAGAAAQLCFVVTAGSDLVESGAATATWSFTAESN